MASVSYQLTPGKEATSDGLGFFEDAIQVGAAAPTTGGAVELRIDLANAPTRQQIKEILRAFSRRLVGERFGSSDIGNI